MGSSARIIDATRVDTVVHLSLTANPSHLEIVNPVVLGKARAKQAYDFKGSQDMDVRD